MFLYLSARVWKKNIYIYIYLLMLLHDNTEKHNLCMGVLGMNSLC
jgi:hypothetical protein